MKILGFSDLHLAKARAADLVAASAEADLVLAAGDYCNMREGLDEAMEMLAGLSAPVVAVPGNAESADELRAAAPDWTVLHGEAAEVEGLRIFGLGYAVPPTPFGHWSCDLSEAETAGMLNTCEAADIMVMHSPPEGVGDRASNGQTYGSTAIREAILRVQPKLVLCGHIHDSWGARGHVGDSLVANCGPAVNWFTP